jgi:sigma-B regulation protein RsbQ
MSVRFRNNVHILGAGPVTMVFGHGFGCDQTMWRFLTPGFSGRFRIVLYDMVGSGGSDLQAYDRRKYATLHGHADDLLEIIDACGGGPVVFVGHSVSAMIGLLAAIKSPGHFLAQVMVGPSPCFINDDDGDYVGGFNRDELDVLLATMEDNFLGTAMALAGVVMGAPDQPLLREELARAFCRNDAVILRHFARVVFHADHRADLARCTVPSLVLQCSDDLLVPHEVGPYMQRHLPNSELRIIDNVGHCPQMSAPDASCAAIKAFLAHMLAEQ